MVGVPRYRVAAQDSIAAWVVFRDREAADTVGRGRSSAPIGCRSWTDERCDNRRAVHIVDVSATLTTCAALRRRTRSGT